MKELEKKQDELIEFLGNFEFKKPHISKKAVRNLVSIGFNAGVKAIIEMSWLNVETDLPPVATEVIGYTKGNDIIYTHYDGENWKNNQEVIYWMWNETH